MRRNSGRRAPVPQSAIPSARRRSEVSAQLVGSRQFEMPSIQAAEFRQALRNLASGVAIVTTGTTAGRRGLTVSSVTSICMEPPCLVVGINACSEAHDPRQWRLWSQSSPH
ncbi:flavin reductase family protein [Bradyrhizobium sp. WSM1743]|uniref:flavin reductase family protein n=1 Tax=Bradyrhizobium sp. WSM1743 TaxID=318996 RepID=UPI0035296A14